MGFLTQVYGNVKKLALLILSDEGTIEMVSFAFAKRGQFEMFPVYEALRVKGDSLSLRLVQHLHLVEWQGEVLWRGQLC